MKNMVWLSIIAIMESVTAHAVQPVTSAVRERFLSNLKLITII